MSPLECSWPENTDLTKQGVEVPGTRRPGQTGHYRNGAWGFKTLEDQPYVRTLADIFELGLSLSTNERFLGHRPVVSTDPVKFADHFVWDTYAEVDVRRRNLGSALHKLFSDGVLGGGELQTVGIWSQNRPEWQMIDLALQAYAKVGVSLYDTLGKDSVGKSHSLINHAQLPVVFVTAQHIPTLLTLRLRIPILRMIVSIDNLSAEARQILTSWGEVMDVQVKEMRELEEFGQANRIDPIPATSDQVVTICYTSGTTGNPKGVMLTHGNLTSAAVSNLHGIDFGDKGLLLSYLPLAHIYERVNELNVMCLGGAIGYFTGDPLRLLEDATILGPNYFPAVPRVLNRVYQTAMLAAQAPGLKGFLFRSAMETKLKQLRETGNNKHAFWDRLVFRKVQAALGGKVVVMTCGSAPINAEVMDFLRIAFACDVIEGYAMTENCGTSCRVFPNDPSSGGFVGAPQPCNELKLVDVAAMKYTSNDKPNPRGEVCVRGNNCFRAYYKDEKSTRETIDEEGWLHTGDVGEIDSYGRLKIIDRIKNIMKLSQGEYVALEKIEMVYGTNPLIAQVYVHGDSLRDYLIGIVVPDPSHLAALASRISGVRITSEDEDALARATTDPHIIQAIFDVMVNEAKQGGLKGFETIKKIHVTLDPFTSENGLLTPTLKIRRRDVRAKYQKELDAMYAEPLASALPDVSVLQPAKL
ncbi:acetyl-CoA synthetase-like protein [Phellopilus nigrolimitatus]|nr:acetyl-CoA synthetase-like protein [Phellopilus nigrolimitatus]